MKHLYFVRHGESELNARHIFAGQIDTPLSAVGREQAKAAGRQAGGLSIDIIVSSPLQRALETARLIAEPIGYPVDDIRIVEVFKERSLGSLEGLSWDDIDETHAKGVDMEDWDALLVRAKQGLDYLQTVGADTVLLAGHGSFARALQMVIDPAGTYPEPENAQIVQLI